MAAPSPDAAQIITRLETLANPEDAAGMARFGIRGARVLGVPVKTLRAIARETGRSHNLAEALWLSGIHEARILASIVAEPKRVTLAQMEQCKVDPMSKALTQVDIGGESRTGARVSKRARFLR